MKGAALFIAIFALALLIVPMIALNFETPAVNSAQTQIYRPGQEQDGGIQPEATQPGGAPEGETGETETVQAEAEAEPEPKDGVSSSSTSEHGVLSFNILNESTGRVETVALRDFVRGAVASEMPVSFHPEALKAQAVAAHTFALHNHRVQLENPDPALKGADFSADPANMLVYTTEERAKAFYGDNGDIYWDRICTAADSVVNYIMEYEDEPIVAAYHAISAGQTEDASNIWTGSAPYLQASDSEGDILAPDYETQVTLPRETVGQAILAAYPEAQLPQDPENWFSGIQRSQSGYIIQVDVGGTDLHGKDIRALFGLRSHNVDISYIPSGDCFSFQVFGYGHGVGLSQYGADFLARQGYTFDEILRNYYTGVTLKQIAPGSVV